MSSFEGYLLFCQYTMTYLKIVMRLHIFFLKLEHLNIIPAFILQMGPYSWKLHKYVHIRARSINDHMLFLQIFNNSWKERRQQALSIYFCLQFGSDRIVYLTEWKYLTSLIIKRLDSRFNGCKYFKLVSFKKNEIWHQSSNFLLFSSEKRGSKSIWAWMWRRKRFWRSWISYLKGKFTKFWILKVLWHEQPYMAVTHWGRKIYQLAIEFTFLCNFMSRFLLCPSFLVYTLKWTDMKEVLDEIMELIMYQIGFFWTPNYFWSQKCK